MKKILLIIILLFTINVKAETITITSNTSLSDKKIEDNREQSNVIIVNNGDLDIKDSTINKSGNGTDNVIDSYKNSAIVINNCNWEDYPTLTIKKRQNLLLKIAILKQVINIQWVLLMKVEK